MSEESLQGKPGGEVIDNVADQRFEMAVDGQVAFAAYRTGPGVLLVHHVETPPALRGGGVAGRLMQGVLEIIRARGLKITPLCPYAEVYIRRHPQYQDLVG